MLEEILSPLHLSDWAAPAIGVLCAALVLLAARAGRRSDPLAPPVPPAPAGGPSSSDPYLQGGRAEKRSSLRRGGSQVSVFVSDAEGEARPIRGTVVDRSAGGLAIAVDEPLPPGEVLSVRVANTQDMPWVQVSVRNFRREGNYYLLGCQFLRPQPWSILLLFG
jgi:PilZ domain